MGGKQCAVLIGTMLGMLGMVGIIIFLIDPFYHYHSPWFGTEVYLYNTVYQTPGAARNLKYDSAIVGTSMSENYDTEWFEKAGWNTVKLSYSGARTDDYKAILTEIYKSSNTVENIVMDINLYQITGDATTQYTERPEYLYDNNLLTDIKYLLNKDVLGAALGRIIDRLEKKEGNWSNAYSWTEETLFGKDIMLADCLGTKKFLLSQPPNNTELEQYKKYCKENLANIICFIQDYPDTQFYFVFTPYSIMYWEQELISGQLENMLMLFDDCARTLLQYPNTHVYYFLDEEKIITNLDLYRDACHYHPSVNQYIAEAILNEDRKISLDNLATYIDNTYQIIMNYDYEKTWKENGL